MSANNFVSDAKFYDDRNFPYGFSRSGDFTFKEVEVLSNCGVVINQLINGTMKPENEEQEHFLQVIEGKTAPLYFVEETYLKYLKLIEKKHTPISSVIRVHSTDYSYEDHSEDAQAD